MVLCALRVETVTPSRNVWKKTWKVLKAVSIAVGYALMLLAVAALWNDDAPQFIYVAF